MIQPTFWYINIGKITVISSFCIHKHMRYEFSAKVITGKFCLFYVNISFSYLHIQFSTILFLLTTKNIPLLLESTTVQNLELEIYKHVSLVFDYELTWCFFRQYDIAENHAFIKFKCRLLLQVKSLKFFALNLYLLMLWIICIKL